MSDRLNRVVLTVLGAVLLVGGGLAACDGEGLFGAGRSRRPVFDSTVARWWHSGGWESYAVVVAIGVAAAVFGGWCASSQLRLGGRAQRTTDFAFPGAGPARGRTSVRAAAVSHGLEADLERIADVQSARVGLFGRYPDLSLRALLDVSDHVDVAGLPGQVDAALGRVERTTGVSPRLVEVTIRFRDVSRKQLLR